MPASEPRHSGLQSEKVCVTSTGASGLDAVDPRFGRCAYFMISDGSRTELKAVENTARTLGNGAGIQAAQTLANMGITIVLTGDLGPNAFRVLEATGIRTFRANAGTVQQAVADYFEGKLMEIEGPTGPGHRGGMGFGQQWQERRGQR